MPTSERFIAKISCSCASSALTEDPVLERRRCGRRSPASRGKKLSTRPSTTPCSSRAGSSTGRVALDVPLAELRQRGCVVAVQGDQEAVGVKAVHLDEPVRSPPRPRRRRRRGRRSRRSRRPSAAGRTATSPRERAGGSGTPRAGSRGRPSSARGCRARRSPLPRATPSPCHAPGGARARRCSGRRWPGLTVGLHRCDGTTRLGGRDPGPVSRIGGLTGWTTPDSTTGPSV